MPPQTKQAGRTTPPGNASSSPRMVPVAEANLSQLGTVVLQPVDVAIRRRGMAARLGLAQRHQGCGFQPAMLLDVTVGEGDVARPVVVAGRIVNDPVRVAWAAAVPGASVAHVHAEKAVVDAVASLVEEHKDFGRLADLHQPAKGLVAGVAPPP